MPTLDGDEAELALMALRHLSGDARAQADGTGTLPRAYGAAWRCCKHVAAKCDALIERIEQSRKDKA